MNTKNYDAILQNNDINVYYIFNNENLGTKGNSIKYF